MGWRKSTIEMVSPAVSLSISSFGVMRAIRSRRRKSIEPEVLVDLLAEFPGHHNAIRVRIRKRTQQNRVEHTEDRGVGSKTQCQREHGDCREPGPPYECAKRIAEALHAVWETVFYSV